ncbi:hypothetical protein HZC32_02610 [Candidatus Woesearchaeota archaeon]|nr:hypothetical protein [Candidatus Woesearchaeota archaeon]
MILLSAFSFGVSDISTIPIDNQITTKEKAFFELNLTNNAAKEQKYTIYSLELGQWNVEPYPLQDKVVTIASGKSYSTKIAVNPLKEFSPGIYFISLTVEGDLGDRYEQKLKIYLSPAEQVVYSPSIKLQVDMPNKIDPQEVVSIKLWLENRNPLNLSNLKVKLVSSEMPEFNKAVVIDLPPLDKKEIEFAVTPNLYQQPKEYVLKFVFERYGEDFKTVEHPVEIVTLLPSFSVLEVHEESSYLKIFRKFTLKNEGNVLNTQKVRVPATFLEGLLTQGEAKAEIEAWQCYITWEVTLGPGNTTLVYSVTNYRMLVYLGIILILIIGFYLYVRSPISVKKTAVVTKRDDRGALSEVKVMVEVKNHSKLPVKDVTIIDLIPVYASLEHIAKESEEAIRPHRTSHVKEGTKVHWSLADLDPGEQRLMTYKVRAKLNILGRLSLPRATAEFTRRNGRMGKAYSGVFRLGDEK